MYQKTTIHFIPDVNEKEEIWNLVTPVVKEIKNKRAEIIKAKKAKIEAKKSLEEGFIENTQENMKKLLLAIKQEGKETRDAFKLVLQAAKGEIQLTDEQKKQIGDQLKDVLKSIGLISIAILPGSFIVGALIKIFKAERLVFPSSLLPEIGDASAKTYSFSGPDPSEVIKLADEFFKKGTSSSVFAGMEFTEPFIFDLILNVRKDTNPILEEDHHFNGLPWEKINFDLLGYSIDANTKMSKSKSKIPKIIVHIILNPKKEPFLYSKLYSRLIDILTHETNHLNQLGINREPFNTQVSSKSKREKAKKSYSYFLLNDEIESMVEGMYESSKEQNIPIDQVFNSYLNPFIESNYITQSEYQQVMKAWVTRAAELYPDAVFSSKVNHIINSI